LVGSHTVEIAGNFPDVSSYTIKFWNGNYSSTNEALIFEWDQNEITEWIVINIKYTNGCESQYIFQLYYVCDNIPYSLMLNGINITNPTFNTHQKYSLCYGSYLVSLLSNEYQIVSVIKNLTTPIPISNNSFTVDASDPTNKYQIKISNPLAGCLDVIYLDITGMCCLPDHSCNGNCTLDAYPNPVSQNLMMNAQTTGISPTGVNYIPLITEVNVYDRYMQLRKRVAPVNSINFNLDIMELNNNEFYIVETKDQYGNACRKTIMISK